MVYESAGFLIHHGIKGQKWGVRNADWYPITDFKAHLAKNGDGSVRKFMAARAEKREKQRALADSVRKAYDSSKGVEYKAISSLSKNKDIKDAAKRLDRFNAENVSADTELYEALDRISRYAANTSVKPPINKDVGELDTQAFRKRELLESKAFEEARSMLGKKYLNKKINSVKLESTVGLAILSACDDRSGYSKAQDAMSKARKARSEAADAEQKYLDKPTEKNYQTWKAKLKAEEDAALKEDEAWKSFRQNILKTAK